eukprot:TRINITY_DN54926_c0_g1_i2.p1 TRINITY_DN54926_c0_g1~~TRINITY_DN54926_c0_g1_i2.p1  ORF type:complete len:231 (+),score=3.45 TRINITY_DN54926_c0_g1_i2:216-908(+)
MTTVIALSAHHGLNSLHRPAPSPSTAAQPRAFAPRRDPGGSSDTLRAAACSPAASSPQHQHHQQRRDVSRRAIKIDRSKQPSRFEDEVVNDDDLEECPAECVREIKSRREFDFILDYADRNNSLVVVDFYRTACGSCKYIEQGFIKLCRAEGDLQHPVIFLKHNVMDDYEERSEIADDLRIKSVPMFHFYRSKTLVEAFPTRDKTKILEAIQKYVPDFETDDEFMASDDE